MTVQTALAERGREACNLTGQASDPNERFAAGRAGPLRTLVTAVFPATLAVMQARLAGPLAPLAAGPWALGRPQPANGRLLCPRALSPPTVGSSAREGSAGPWRGRPNSVADFRGGRQAATDSSGS